MKSDKGLVLITGVNGRIGSAVARRLAARFSEVIGFDQHAPSPPPPDCTRIPVDVSSEASVRDGLGILRAHHGERIPHRAAPR